VSAASRLGSTRRWRVRFGCQPKRRTIISVPKPLNQLLSADSEMRGDIGKNSSQRSHFERVVIGNRDVMPTTLARSQSQVAARLPCDLVAESPSRLARSAPETSLGSFILPTEAVSTGAQPASTSSRTKCKRITFGAFPSSKWQFTASRMLTKGVQSVRLGKDRLPQSPRGKAALYCFLDQENDFVHARAIAPLDCRDFPRFSCHWQESSRLVAGPNFFLLSSFHSSFFLLTFSRPSPVGRLQESTYLADFCSGC
jgi:hypothetical protein